MDTQAKLLRVIQEREFMRLGGTENIKVDVRILAATNSDLKEMVQAQKFREDLYYRLNVITVNLPPLRERKEDIPMLADHFLAKYCSENRREGLKFSPAAMKLLMDHDWPGNVRELENAVERAVVLATGQLIGPEALPEPVLEDRREMPESFSAGDVDGRSLSEILEEYERRVILDMLSRTNWSQTDAADRFKIPLSTLNQKIKRLRIDVKQHRKV